MISSHRTFASENFIAIFLLQLLYKPKVKEMFGRQQPATCPNTLFISSIFHRPLIEGGGGGGGGLTAGSESCGKLVIIQLLCSTADLINLNHQKWAQGFVLIGFPGDC